METQTLMFKTLLTTLLHTGIDTKTPESQFVIATNLGIVVIWAISLPYVFVFYYFDWSSLFLINATMEVVYPTVLLFNRYHHHLIAKHWFIILGYVHVSLVSVFLGIASGAELYYYLLPILSIFIYSPKEKHFILASLFLFSLFYAITQYLYTIIEPQYVKPEILKMIYYSSYGVVIFCITVFFYHFKNSSLHFQNRLEKERTFNKTLLDSQEQLIITTDGEQLLTANETFFDFFAVDSIEEFIQTYNASCICDLFNADAPADYLHKQMENEHQENWIDYVISQSFGTTHKVMITMGSRDFIFSVSAAKLAGDNNVKSAVFTDITEMENAKNEIETINKHVRESIEYASLIQSALIPDHTRFRNYFQDYFTIWHPKDIVGGDIYLFEELRDENECLLMIIDCTGHGVPGAFVTMLVKAIERQIVGKINYSDEDVSPAKILSIFNNSMKHLLKQESTDSVSNAGFDGGILYLNKKKKIIKYAGAHTPLFIVENGTIKTIKGDRYSVGYKKSASDYEFKEYTIDLHNAMQLYLSTDGFFDQTGGKQGFPFGKRRFVEMIQKYHKQPMKNQQQKFLDILSLYQGNEEKNDDITVVGLKI